MNKFVEKLRLKEMAEEDIYFAKQDLKLIKALHQKKLAKLVKCEKPQRKKQAKRYEKRFDAITEKHKRKPHKLLKAYRSLLQEIKHTCKPRR